MSVVNKVKEYRKKAKITQTELAKKAGVSRQSIYAIETQKSEPSLELAFKISHILNIPLTEVFVWENSADSNNEAIPAFSIF